MPLPSFCLAILHKLSPSTTIEGLALKLNALGRVVGHCGGGLSLHLLKLNGEFIDPLGQYLILLFEGVEVLVAAAAGCPQCGYGNGCHQNSDF